MAIKWQGRRFTDFKAMWCSSSKIQVTVAKKKY